MPLPHLHLLHPMETYAPHLPGWLGEVQSLMLADPNWDGCRPRRVAYDRQAGFNLPTEVDRVRREPGPVIFIQKVQARLLDRFRQLVQRQVAVYAISPTCSRDIWAACETAREEYEDGHPRIPLRELIAYLILRKLERQDKWGGLALNKCFLKSEVLPNGGFPKGICSPRDIQQVADVLRNAGVLAQKKSQGRTKYALGDKAVVQPILDSKSFEAYPGLRNYFDRSTTHVPARLLDYNED